MESKTFHDESTITGTSRNRAVQQPDKPYLVSRFDRAGCKTDQVHTMTWGEMDEAITSLCKGLDVLGVKTFDRVAVFGPNTPRWIMATFSGIFLRGTFVPIYPSSKAEDVWWILQDASAKVLFCHGTTHLEKALQVKDRLDALAYIIVMDPDAMIDSPDVLSFDDLLEKGRAAEASEEKIEARFREVHEEDLAAIIYTSGTTGKPKGVMLTHKNFVSQRTGSEFFDFRPGDIWFAHLPMCHSFGFTSDLLNCGFQGGTLFVCDTVEIEEMRKNLLECRPTIMSSVPRLWEKLYIQINSMVGQRPKAVQNIFKWAMSIGKECFLREIEHKPISPLLRLQAKMAGRIFTRIKQQMGMDRLRLCFTGGGPINRDLIVFFGSMGIRLYQGFGLTETAPITHTCTPKDHKLGWVGKPIPGTECKIAEDGELLIRGPQVMKGYYNNPEATREVFTEDGFFRTGDIGEIDKDGYLRITDRKYLAALVVPNFLNLEAWARDQGISFTGPEDLIKNDTVTDLIQERIQGVNATLARYETIKRFALLPEEFTEANGELTPTLKKKRRVIDQKYKEAIESLYSPE